MFELTKYQFHGKGMPIIPFRMISDTAPVRFPSSDSDYYGDIISIDRSLVKNPDFTYLLGVVGDSMIDAGILPGCWVLVDRSTEPMNGNIVVAHMEGALTVKYYTRTTDSCFLTPANSKYARIPITELADFVVWGVVIHIIATANPISYIRFI